MLVRERDDVERQLGEQKVALEQQMKRYEEMQARIRGEMGEEGIDCISVYIPTNKNVSISMQGCV